MANTRKDAPKQKKIEIRIPAKIRRKCVGSKLFKLERDGDRMKLAEYLAKYLDEYNGGSVYGVTGDVGDLEESIQAGIEAFAKQEDVVITVFANTPVMEIY